MTYSERYKIEQRHNEDELFNLCLYKEGEFWRAYEWSAYLACHFDNGLKERLNPIRRTSKDLKNESLIYIGVPQKSMDKYFPKIGEPVVIEENYVVYNVQGKILDDNINLLNYSEKLQEWKNQTPFKKDEKDNTTNTSKLVAQNITTSTNILDIDSLHDVVVDLVSFDIMRHNGIETIAFFSAIQRRFAKIMKI